MEYENIYDNQMKENIIDEINNFDEDNNNFNEYDRYEQEEDNNNFNEYDKYEQENNFQEGAYLNDNEIYNLNEENIKLKNKCKELNKIIFFKNKELEDNKLKNDNKIIKVKEIINKYKMHIQKFQNDLNSTKKKYFDALKEIKMKNKVISDLQNGVNIKDINLDNYYNEKEDNILLSINEQIKNIQKDFFEEENIENNNENNDIKDELQKLDTNYQVQLIMNNLNIFAERLNEYKNNNMKEIIKLRNIIDANENENSAINLKDQIYLNIIDIIKNLCNTVGNITGHIPDFSLNDDKEKKIKNIQTTMKILADYIITNNKKSQNNQNNNNINEELNKRLKLMSEELIKSNKNFSKMKNDQKELKQKYILLQSKYNELVNNENKNKIDNDKDYEKLMDELNKKNQQIKSLEHMVTRLTNKINENTNNNEDLIINNNNNKSKNTINNFVNNNNSHYEDNKFVKDEKNEKNLKKFLDKFTNGEYGNLFKKNNNIDNLKEELEILSKRINKELENNK